MWILEQENAVKKHQINSYTGFLDDNPYEPFIYFWKSVNSEIKRIYKKLCLHPLGAGLRFLFYQILLRFSKLAEQTQPNNNPYTPKDCEPLL